MKTQINRRRRATQAICCAAFVITLAGVVGPAQAQPYTLVDNNSVANINLTSARGMYEWFVQGQNQMAQQWFWYRVGNTPEASIDTISAPSVFQSTPRSLTTTYANSQFRLRIDYLLNGGATVGVGQTANSGISESITIFNTSSSTLDFHFFQYSDYDLGGSSANDTVQLGTNLQGLFNEAVQFDGIVALTETVTTPGANHGEAAVWPLTLNKLYDGVPTTLTDNAGPVLPNDVSWAFQWDLSIASGASAQINKDKYLSVVIVPEPSILALAGLAIFAGALWRRRS
jgi:hypothetical protein